MFTWCGELAGCGGCGEGLGAWTGLWWGDVGWFGWAWLLAGGGHGWFGRWFGPLAPGGVG